MRLSKAHSTARVADGRRATALAGRSAIGRGLLLAFLVAFPAAAQDEHSVFQPEGSPIAVPLPLPLPAARLGGTPVADAATGGDGATAEIPTTEAPEDVTVTPPEQGGETPPSPLATDGLPPPTGAELSPEPPASARVTTIPGETVMALAEGEGVRLLYATDGDTIDDAGRGVLADIADQAKEDEGRRLEIRAYAGGTPDLAAHARRLSLDRALAVRAYLIDRGIASARIDVRALGNTAPDGPADRVDVFLR